MSQDALEQKQILHESDTRGAVERPPSGWGPALWIASGMYIAADLRNHEPLRTMIASETVKTVIVGVAVIAVFVVYLALRAYEFRIWRRRRPPRTVESALNVALACDPYQKNLCDAELSGQDLRNINLAGARCLRIRLEGANLAGSRLANCDLRGASLRRVNFSGCDLAHSDLRGADLCGADFTGANLQHSNFHEARVGDAGFANAIFGGTLLIRIDLSQARDLDTVRHQSPSTLGLDTFYQSRPALSDLFLRGIGVDDGLLQRVHSMKAVPESHALCLISYAGADQKFAERLHEDLRNRGIRCWFAPKDMPVGERIRARLEKSLRECDKVVLVLSRNSLTGEWVEHEVQTILERERAEGSRSLLLPLALDDAFLNSEAPWALALRRSRRIADFAGWKQPDHYQMSLREMLRELAHETPAAATAEVS